MEKRFPNAFMEIEELEKGATANLYEGRMIGHYLSGKVNLASI